MTIGKIKVASKRDNLYEELGWVNIVCDRTSLLGNLFDMNKNESLRHADCMAERMALDLSPSDNTKSKFSSST